MGRTVDPCSPNVTELAEFLHYLYDEKKLSCATIKTYRSAVSSTIKFISGLDFSNDMYLRHLMEAFFKRRPRSLQVVPAWNLAAVLHALTKSPFEPPHQVPIKYLAWKTLFLTALASGKRRSEIHALTDDYERGEFWEKIILRPKLSFLAKAHTENNPRGEFISVTIPALTSVGDNDPDRTLCPVRALKWYLTRTQPERRHIPKPRPLFLPLKVGRRTSISAVTLGVWAKRLLVLCLENAGEEEAAIAGKTIHELRRQSTSWNALHTNDFGHILAAGQWAHHTTFTSHYLLNMTTVKDKLYKLGPIVTAQSVITPPQR